MSQQVTIDTAADIVVILSLSNAPAIGLADTDVTATYRKEGGVSFSAYALTPSNFTEIGSGVYTIQFTAAELDTVGSFTVVVTGATIDQSVTIAQVVTATQAATPISVQTCTLTGHIVNAKGEPVANAAVSARILGLPSIEQSLAATTDDLVTATTDSNGEFFLTLIRLADVEVVIPAANYRRQIVVPNQSTANLWTDIP